MSHMTEITVGQNGLDIEIPSIFKNKAISHLFLESARNYLVFLRRYYFLEENFMTSEFTIFPDHIGRISRGCY